MKSILGNLLFLIAIVGCSLCGHVAGDRFCGRHDSIEAAAEMQDRMDVLAQQVWELEQQQHPPILESKVLSLPDDASGWHTVLIVNQDFARRSAQRAAVTMFSSDPTLSSLKAQTHFHQICVEQPEFKKFAGHVDAVPCLILERCNGQVIYRESGPHLGKDPRGLVKAIRKECQRHCPDGRCIPIHPTPDQPAPAVPDAPPSAVLNPGPADEPARASLVPAALVTFAAAVGGFALKFYRATV